MTEPAASIELCLRAVRAVENRLAVQRGAMPDEEARLLLDLDLAEADPAEFAKATIGVAAALVVMAEQASGVAADQMLVRMRRLLTSAAG
jgi:hypothetical protein